MKTKPTLLLALVASLALVLSACYCPAAEGDILIDQEDSGGAFVETVIPGTTSAPFVFGAAPGSPISIVGYPLGENLSIVDGEIVASGGGASAINDLTDVVITTVGDGHFLTYDSGTSKWVNEPLGTMASQSSSNVSITGGGIGVSTLAAASRLGVPPTSVVPLANSYDIGIHNTLGFQWRYGSTTFTGVSLAGTQSLTNKELISPVISGGTISGLTSLEVGSVSNAEIGYLDGVTSAIQTQIDGKLTTTDLGSAELIVPTSNYTATSATLAGHLAGINNKFGEPVVVPDGDKGAIIISGGVWGLDGDTGFGSDFISAISAEHARIKLGLVLGTNVQAYDADLADLADGSLGVAKIDFGTGTDGYVWTSDGAGAEAWEALPASGIGGSTGATDNAILVADGPGGSTLKASNATISPSGALTVDVDNLNGETIAQFKGGAAANTGLIIRTVGAGDFGGGYVGQPAIEMANDLFVFLDSVLIPSGKNFTFGQSNLLSTSGAGTTLSSGGATAIAGTNIRLGSDETYEGPLRIRSGDNSVLYTFGDDGDITLDSSPVVGYSQAETQFHIGAAASAANGLLWVYDLQSGGNPAVTISKATIGTALSLSATSSSPIITATGGSTFANYTVSNTGTSLANTHYRGIVLDNRIDFDSYSATGIYARGRNLRTSAGSNPDLALGGDFAAASGITGGTYGAAVRATAESANVNGVQVVLHGSQSAHAVEVRNSGGTVIFAVTASGGVLAPNLPTSEPATVGELWVDGTTVKVSDGP